MCTVRLVGYKEGVSGTHGATATEGVTMTSMNVNEALATNPTAIVGWWTSVDGSGCLDMTGATVIDAVAELLAQCADDTERAAVYAGSLEVEIND